MHPCTINDLEPTTFKLYKTAYLQRHQKLLKQFFTSSEIGIIKKSFCYRLFSFFCPQKFESELSNILEETQIKYSNKLYIPEEFSILMKAIQAKDLSITGIFRISADFQRVNEVEQKYITMVKNNDKSIERLLINEDVFLLTALFTRVFKHFKGTLLPKNYLNPCVKAHLVQDETIKVKLLQSIFLGLNYENRALFESIGKFVRICSDNQTKNNGEHLKTMNLDGIVTVIAPKVLCAHGEKIDDLDFFKCCVDMLIFVFENIERILTIDSSVDY